MNQTDKGKSITLYTIGSSKKLAEQFFGLLKEHGIQRLVDVRRRNRSNLLGFARQADLQYLLRELCSAEYRHAPDLAPPQDLLDAWQKKEISWTDYEARFIPLLKQWKVEARFNTEFFARPTVLLCSEPSADQCHRRLVAEYLSEKYPEIEVVHI